MKLTGSLKKKKNSEPIAHEVTKKRYNSILNINLHHKINLFCFEIASQLCFNTHTIYRVQRAGVSFLPFHCDNK